MGDEEQEEDRDERYKDPHPQDNRVVWVGMLCATKTNEAW